MMNGDYVTSLDITKSLIGAKTPHALKKCSTEHVQPAVVEAKKKGLPPLIKPRGKMAK